MEGSKKPKLRDIFSEGEKIQSKKTLIGKTGSRRGKMRTNKLGDIWVETLTLMELRISTF